MTAACSQWCKSCLYLLKVFDQRKGLRWRGMTWNRKKKVAKSQCQVSGVPVSVFVKVSDLYSGVKSPNPAFQKLWYTLIKCIKTCIYLFFWSSFYASLTYSIFWLHRRLPFIWYKVVFRQSDVRRQNKFAWEPVWWAERTNTSSRWRYTRNMVLVRAAGCTLHLLSFVYVAFWRTFFSLSRLPGGSRTLDVTAVLA